MEPSIEIIVATDSCGGFGLNGKIPWTCKEDMKHFATVSKECGVCVMGRATYEDMLSMRGDLTDELKEKITSTGILPERVCYVVSSTLDSAVGATVVKDLREVLNIYHQTSQRVAVIGGEKMYTQAIASAKVVHMTVIGKSFNCDRVFPVDYLHKHFNLSAGPEPAAKRALVNEVETPLVFTKYHRR